MPLGSGKKNVLTVCQYAGSNTVLWNFMTFGIYLFFIATVVIKVIIALLKYNITFKNNTIYFENCMLI